jgi:Putative addiction module component
MSTITEKVCIEALSLPKQARAEIAHRLLVSLEEEDYTEEVSGVWQNVIQRRREDFTSGNAHPVPGDEALRQAYAAIE